MSTPAVAATTPATRSLRSSRTRQPKRKASPPKTPTPPASGLQVYEDGLAGSMKRRRKTTAPTAGPTPCGRMALTPASTNTSRARSKGKGKGKGKGATKGKAKGNTKSNTQRRPAAREGKAPEPASLRRMSRRRSTSPAPTAHVGAGTQDTAVAPSLRTDFVFVGKYGWVCMGVPCRD